MSRERNHHYVPEFHLRRFATGPKREVAVFDKKFGKFGLRPAASSARALDYYLVPGASADERLSVEREFARLENLIAPLIARLDAADPGHVRFAEVERHNLAMYAAILHTRVPAYRDDALKRAQELATDPDAMGLADPIDFRRSMRRRGRKDSDAEFEALRLGMVQAVESDDFSVTVRPMASLGGVTAAVKLGVPLMLGREWELLREPAWPGLIIGDQPVGLFSHGSLAPSIGFGSPGVQIFMPLSPRTLLLISDRPRRADLTVKVNTGRGLRGPWWVLANQVAWLTSQRYVWGRMHSLQATEAVIPPNYRRRDLRDLDEDQEAKRKVVAMERRQERRRQRLES